MAFSDLTHLLCQTFSIFERTIFSSSSKVQTRQAFQALKELSDEVDKMQTDMDEIQPPKRKRPRMMIDPPLSPSSDQGLEQPAELEGEAEAEVEEID